jgi:hypothetical protein
MRGVCNKRRHRPRLQLPGKLHSGPNAKYLTALAPCPSRACTRIWNPQPAELRGTTYAPKLVPGPPRSAAPASRDAKSDQCSSK